MREVLRLCARWLDPSEDVIEIIPWEGIGKDGHDGR